MKKYERIVELLNESKCCDKKDKEKEKKLLKKEKEEEKAEKAKEKAEEKAEKAKKVKKEGYNAESVKFLIESKNILTNMTECFLESNKKFLFDKTYQVTYNEALELFLHTYRNELKVLKEAAADAGIDELSWWAHLQKAFEHLFASLKTMGGGAYNYVANAVTSIFKKKTPDGKVENKTPEEAKKAVVTDGPSFLTKFWNNMKSMFGFGADEKIADAPDANKVSGNNPSEEKKDETKQESTNIKFESAQFRNEFKNKVHFESLLRTIRSEK